MCHTDLLTACEQDQDGTGLVLLILLASSMTYTIAVCTVKNSWWLTEEMSETCRFLFQNKFEKLVHLVGFITRIYHDERQISLVTSRLCIPRLSR